MKKTIMILVLGIVIGTISSVLASTLLASNVAYTPKDSKWKVNNVGSALDDLYTNAKVSLNKFCELKSGDALAIGSMYECDPGDGIKRNFYVLEVRNNEVDLIMEQNIAKGAMTWYNAMKYFSDGAGSSIKSAWTNVLNIDLPKAQAIANAVGNSSWKAAENNDYWWCLETKKQDTTSRPYCYNNTQNTMWLWDYTRECASWKCTHSLDSEWAYGYWTRDVVVNKDWAWSVLRFSDLCYNYADDTNYGVRPVITVLKSNLS